MEFVMTNAKLTKLTKLTLALGAMVMAGAAIASDSGSGSMSVAAYIMPECAVGNTTSLNFSAVSMLTAEGGRSEANRTSTGGTFDVICTNGTTAPKLRFSSANAAGSNFRLVGVDGSSYIVYNLSESGGRNAIMSGNDAAFTGLTADGSTKSLQIVGTIAASARYGKAAQYYSDTITITSSYSSVD